MDMDTENRIVTPDLSPEDTDLEFSLRFGLEDRVAVVIEKLLD